MQYESEYIYVPLLDGSRMGFICDQATCKFRKLKAVFKNKVLRFNIIITTIFPYILIIK